ncbi:hypothetical protein K488DRAFT_58102 [Vararia minispora EC-137]|uniref:Uncharacterized protein n=1 Tax=Vararia minispora EC-137 TaxID=1314806 RepID=A0ACB8QA71_9AGAM|nr:hypothetical protein K488DRAFT_58102 [Vararia minispora EC-137]
MFLNRCSLSDGEWSHIMWCRDFNRHHPLWDDPAAGHLSTPRAIKDAELLIQALGDDDLIMALKPSSPTLQHSITKCWSCLDSVWISSGLIELVTLCSTLPD